MRTTTYIKVKLTLDHTGKTSVKELIENVYMDITYPDKNEAEIIAYDIVETDCEEV